MFRSPSQGPPFPRSPPRTPPPRSRKRGGTGPLCRRAQAHPSQKSRNVWFSNFCGFQRLKGWMLDVEDRSSFWRRNVFEPNQPSILGWEDSGATRNQSSRLMTPNTAFKQLNKCKLCGVHDREGLSKDTIRIAGFSLHLQPANPARHQACGCRDRYDTFRWQ